MKKQISARPYQVGMERIVFGLGLIPRQGVPEIKVSYSRSGKKFLGKVGNSKDAADFIRKTFKPGTIQLQEQFIAVYLNQANEILGYYKHSIGAINATIADVRLIFATALASASVSLLVAHNHPSGNLQASQPDIDLTKKLQNGGKFLDIRLLDHIIITKGGYYSFADNGML